jgi:histidyl-tRNA synthetase
LLDVAFSQKLLKLGSTSPTQVLVTVYSEDQRRLCNQLAQKVRNHGLNCEVYYKASKLGKQLDYAASRGARWALFVDAADQHLEVKDLSTKEQKRIDDLEAWCKGL